MDGIKISVEKFGTLIQQTEDEVWYGILKREFKNKKNTFSEWKALIETLKARPAK
jgi:hypothetical protein